jgi:hypothetical protein
MTRRSAIRAGLGFPLGALAYTAGAFPAAAFAKEFWNERKPEDWTSAEVKELLTKSPWAKDASIDDKGQVGSLGAPRTGASRRGVSVSSGGRGGTTAPGNPPKITWKAVVRWESALPLREALKGKAPKDVKDFYVLNLVGNLPSAIPAPDEPEDRASLAYLKEVTKLQHKGDEIHVTRVEEAPENQFSEAGTYFYFSRMLALMPEDKETTFVSKIGPLDVKCKFTLRDMMYHGQMEL